MDAPVSSSPVTWQSLLRRWDAIRAGWPTLLLPAIGFMVVLVVDPTGQGREALYAISQWPGFWKTILAFIACGVILHGRFLIAINQFYPFSLRANPGTKAVPYAAWFAACAPALICAALYFNDAVFVLHRREALEQLAGKTGPLVGLLGSAGAILVLTLWHMLASKLLVRVIQAHSSRFLVFDKSWRTIRIILFAFIGSVAAATWWLPTFAAWLGPISVFLIGATLWSVVANFLVSEIAKRDWPPAILIFPAWIVLMGVVTSIFNHFNIDHYTLLTEPIQRTQTADAKAYARDWLKTHRTSDGSPTPAIFVLADGGGIRAALHTSSVLAGLDRATNGEFYKHIYAMSGVSGGAVGIATYVAAHAAHISSDEIVPKVRKILTDDHFSPLLAGLVMGDMPTVAMPFYILGDAFHIPSLNRDRSRIFEQSFEERRKDIGAQFRRGVSDVMTDTQPLGTHLVPPIILLNTTNANNGELETVSNVSFRTAFPGDATVPCNVIGRLASGRTLSLGTAALLSARFPIVSPPGLLVTGREACGDPIRTRVQYVDGAYLDNTGALAASAALKALNYVVQHDRKLAAPKVIVLYIYAATLVSDNGSPGRASLQLADLSAPVNAVVAARHYLGLSPLTEFCRKVASADAKVAGVSAETCGRLRGLREINSKASRESGNERPRSPREIETKFWDDDSLPWFNAALGVAASSTDVKNYVPLGWLLGPSRFHVEHDSCQMAQDIVAKLGPLLGIMPNAENCDTQGQ